MLEDRPKTVAHCASPFLQKAGTWTYVQVVRLRRYRPVVLTQAARNREDFPVQPLYSAEDYAAPKKLANRLVRRLTGEYPFYGPILRREDASLIHAHFGWEGCRLLGARRRSGLPLLTSFYGADATEYARYPRWRARFARLFAEGELFLGEGSAMLQRLEELGCPPAKLRLWRLGVDVERIPFCERRSDGPVRFLICAGFREKKGIPYALQALALAAGRRPFPFSVVLIGDGPERPAIEGLVGELGLGGQVVFRGMQPYAEVLAELARCHILLQTSVTAQSGDGEGGAPVILLDAQASGMPVVATEHADIPEYVRHGISGLLAPERDVEGLAAHILRLVEEPEQWAAMGRAGRLHVEARYNAEKQMAELERIYDELT